jgi:uncharacterized protein (TIGR04255 family)
LWEIDANEAGVPFDPGYDVAQGVFVQSVKREFPVHKRLIPESAPILLYPKPVHQLWKGELIWPVVQLGQGIMAVNDTDDNYVWEDNYRPLIHKALKWLADSYDRALVFKRVYLEYIDAVDLTEAENQDVPNFVSQNFRIFIQNKFDFPGRLGDFNLAQTFSLEDQSNMLVTIKNGHNNNTGSPALIWTIRVQKKGKMDANNILGWLDSAHSITSNTFVDMLNPDFYARFL